jgi:predicted lipoprotein with Yx(FWY)xxD motif
MTRNRPITYIVGAAVAGFIALGLAACGGGGSGAAAATPKPATTASGKAATVGVASSSLGQILVDAQGNTLYLFQKDTGTKSECSGPCASEWPPLTVSGKATAGTGANSSMLGAIPRSDGKPQVTYNGHPLYLYSGDSKAGDTNGQGVSAFGALWYTVSPQGSQITSQASSSGGGSTY